jgi:hypothetical protein
VGSLVLTLLCGTVPPSLSPRLVKKGIVPKPITLAIGDGANDVAMIQEAQVRLDTRTPALGLLSLDTGFMELIPPHQHRFYRS